MAKTKIVPEIVDFSNFGGNGRSRDFYKGTSFRWAFEWEAGKHYSSDTYFIDFVAYEGIVYVCTKSHLSRPEIAPAADSEFWSVAIENIEGPKGEKGDPGANGVDGTNGIDGKDGLDGISGASAIHIGAESPCEYKAAHEDDPRIQQMYAYCEHMLWINPEESADNSYTELLYAAYKECGGSLSKEDFCTQFSKLGESDDSFDSSLYYTKEEIDSKLDGVENVDLSNYYTKEEAENYIASQNFLTEVPSEYVTETMLDAYVTDVELQTVVNETVENNDTIVNLETSVTELSETVKQLESTIIGDVDGTTEEDWGSPDSWEI